MLPSGTAAELLPQLVTEAAKLSTLIADGGDKTAAVERIEALWAAVRSRGDWQGPRARHGDRSRDRQGPTAAEFNRAAAADKVYRNLTALVQAYLTGLHSDAGKAAQAWTIVRRRGAAGERDVQRAQALLLLVDDRRRLDDDDAVELEALDDADRHDGDARVEAGARRPAVGDAGGVERVARRRRPSSRGRRRRSLPSAISAVSVRVAPATTASSSRPAVDARRTPGASSPARTLVGARSVGRGGQHHLVGQRHDLGRDAVADAQADDPRRAAGRAGGAARRPSRSGARAPVAWAMSPTTVMRPLSERRATIRSCIGVRSWTSSITMWP